MAEQVKGFAEHFAGFKRHIKLAVAVFSVILTFGVALPLLSTLPPMRAIFRFFAYPVAPWQYAIPFMATYMLHDYVIYPQEAYGYAPREYSETLLAACQG